MGRRLGEVLVQTPCVWERYAAFGAFGCRGVTWNGMCLASASPASPNPGGRKYRVRAWGLGPAVHLRRHSFSLLTAALGAWMMKSWLMY